ANHRPGISGLLAGEMESIKTETFDRDHHHAPIAADLPMALETLVESAPLKVAKAAGPRNGKTNGKAHVNKTEFSG
ncbi:MAG: hypothetical protein ACK2UH_08485, partial [Candidatus Promineifilaceae bacterium]